MATSSKVLFKLETLKEKALESINQRVEQQRLHVESFESDDALTERVDAWFTEQKQRVLDLAERVSAGTVSGHELTRFKIAPIPEVSFHERSREESRLRELEALRTKIVAKADSLVPDENGNISLTKTQLQEFFAL